MPRYFLDFEGWCTIEAEDEHAAEEKLYDIIDTMTDGDMSLAIDSTEVVDTNSDMSLAIVSTEVVDTNG